MQTILSPPTNLLIMLICMALSAGFLTSVPWVSLSQRDKGQHNVGREVSREEWRIPASDGLEQSVISAASKVIDMR